MPLSSFPSPPPFFQRFVLRRARWSALSAFGGMIVLIGNATWVAGTPPLMPQDVHIEVPADSLFGSLPINRGLTVSIHIPEQPSRHGQPFVAVLESPAFAPHTIPLEIDPDRHRYSATVDLGRLSTTMGTPPKATPIQVQIARQRGLHLETLVRRTVVVTIATPGYADHQAATVDLSTHMTDRSRRTEDPPSDLALLDGRVDEEDLLEDRRLSRQEGYWKVLQRLIHRRMQDEAAPYRHRGIQRVPGIGFRLYANGEAQLIEVERSSGDLALDQAALLAVINAHPFPRFPAGTRDAHIAVHVDVPTPAR
ncbi:MAG: TonB family protein [Nitrospira defluvii]|nr:TonB family protein [Nitrospira defluvii]